MLTYPAYLKAVEAMRTHGEVVEKDFRTANHSPPYRYATVNVITAPADAPAMAAVMTAMAVEHRLSFSVYNFAHVSTIDLTSSAGVLLSDIDDTPRCKWCGNLIQTEPVRGPIGKYCDGDHQLDHQEHVTD